MKILVDKGFHKIKWAILFPIGLGSFVIPNINSFANDQTIARYDSMFSSPEGVIRFMASQELSEGKAEGIDTATAIQMIINALASEISSPAPINKAIGTYAPGTEFLKKNYGIALEKLSKGRENLIKEFLNNATGELRTRLILVLGFLMDSSVHKEIGQIYGESQDPYIRLSAIEALSQYKDTLDLRIFETALYDSFYVYDFLDEKGNPINTNHPIGVLARGALLKMGYNVVFKDGKYEVTKRK